MGNVLQSCQHMSCLQICFGSHYKRWSDQDQFDHRLLHGRQNSVGHRIGSKRNRVREYLAWALHRSRLPLFSDNQFDHTPLDIEAQDPNTVSWISEAGSSEASHTLYRELDPYNYASVNESLLPSPSNSSIASDLCKSGSFAAVTRLTGAKNQTATSLVFLPNTDDPQQPIVAEEEVDGLELARLARDMWSRWSGSHRRHTRRKGAVNKSTTGRHSIPHSVPPQTGEISPEPPAVDLDWDHEPGTISPHFKQTTIKRPQLPRAHEDPSKPQQLLIHPSYSNEALQTKLFPVRPRRHNVARLPLTTDDNELDHHKVEQMKRWSYSDKLVPASSWLQADTPDVIKHSKVTSPPPKHQNDELCDSGFVGLGSSFVEEQSEGQQFSDHLLWENELFVGAR